jgi:hypothetical protein
MPIEDRTALQAETWSCRSVRGNEEGERLTTVERSKLTSPYGSSVRWVSSSAQLLGDKPESAREWGLKYVPHFTTTKVCHPGSTIK